MKLFGAGGFIGLAIAFAGAAVSYGLIEAQDRAAQAAVVASLVTDDAAETADAIVQAHEMGVIRLSDAERDRLLTVLDRDLRAGVARAAMEPSPLTRAAPEAVAQALYSPDRATRVVAAQAVVARRDDAAMTEAMIAVLEQQAAIMTGSSTPSSAGVHTLVYALNEQGRASWTDDLRRRCVDVLMRLDEAHAIASPTQGMADALSERLQAGLAGA